jgi:hypothetical protein
MNASLKFSGCQIWTYMMAYVCMPFHSLLSCLRHGFELKKVEEKMK